MMSDQENTVNCFQICLIANPNENMYMYMNVTPLSHTKHWKQTDRQTDRQTETYVAAGTGWNQDPMCSHPHTLYNQL